MAKKSCTGIPGCVLACLTLVIIVLILGVLIFPLVNRSDEEARKTQCRSNLGVIGVALSAYAADNGGYLPPIAPEAFQASKESGVPAGSYLVIPTSPDNAVKTGLGFLWPNYLASYGLWAPIFYCPSQCIADEKWNGVFSFDRDEPFWTSKGKIIRGNGNGKGDVPWDNIHGEIITNYTLRPAQPDANWKLDKMGRKALASDVMILRPSGWDKPIYQNHLGTYNVLYGDGRVIEYKDTDHEVAKRLAGAGSVDEIVLKIFEEVFDRFYVPDDKRG